jgi:hypothetical protein
MSYDAIALCLISIPIIITIISSKLEFFILNDIPIAKFFGYLLAGWLMLPILDLAIKINDDLGYGAYMTISSAYYGIMVLMLVITFLSILGLIGFAVKLAIPGGK